MKKLKAVKVWQVSFELKDDGFEGNHFTRKEITEIVKDTMPGLKVTHLVLKQLW